MNTLPTLYVTFDTNTAARIVTVYRANRDGNSSAYAGKPEAAILAAIVNGRVKPFASSVSLDLEGIPRTARLQYFANYFGTLGVTQPIVIHATQQKRYADFVGLGGAFLHLPRIGMEHLSPLVVQHMAADTRYSIGERQERSFRGLRAAESWGCGKAHLQAIADAVAPGAPLVDALGKVSQAQTEDVADAIAEWADADAVSAHYGYGNDYFCTEDKASAAGPTAVFSSTHRQAFYDQFNVEIVDLARLAAVV